MPETKPSFYKNFIEDCANKLSLPLFFVLNYEQFLPKTAKLRISSGKTWDVKLEETEFEKCCFVGGWTKFVMDLGLELGELLFFWFNVDDSIFDVKVYGRSCCVREISDMTDDDEDNVFMNHGAPNVPPDLKETRSRSFTPKSEDSGAYGKTNPRFEVLLTEKRSSRMVVPKIFAEAAGLIGKRAVVLVYPPKLQYWCVVLSLRPISGFHLNMTTGWSDFRKENGLVYGKTYSFEFDSTKNVIKVKEKKN